MWLGTASGKNNCGAAVASHGLLALKAASAWKKTGNGQTKMLSTISLLLPVGDHQDTLKLQVHKKKSAFLAAVAISLSSVRQFISQRVSLRVSGDVSVGERKFLVQGIASENIHRFDTVITFCVGKQKGR